MVHVLACHFLKKSTLLDLVSIAGSTGTNLLEGKIMEFHVWLAFASASIALLLIPGPTVLLILSYAISQGRRVALATVAGVALGDLVAMSASLAGLGALVLASSKLLILLKWIGAIYLVYLGIKLFRSAPDASLEMLDDAPATSPRKVCAHTAAVTALIHCFLHRFRPAVHQSEHSFGTAVRAACCYLRWLRSDQCTCLCPAR